MIQESVLMTKILFQYEQQNEFELISNKKNISKIMLYARESAVTFYEKSGFVV